MKRKIKRVAVKVSAIIGAVLLLALIAIPAFAMITEDNAMELYRYLDIGETPNDPLAVILNSSGMVDDATFQNSALWYRGVFANGATAGSLPSFPSSSISGTYSSNVYWCIVYEDIAGGDVVDISYGNGTMEFSYSYSGSSGTFYSLEFNGTQSGSSWQNNYLQVLKRTDNTVSCSAYIDGMTRTNNTSDTRIRVGIVSENAQPSPAFALFRRQPVLTTEIEVYPQSVQEAVTAGIGSVSQEQLEEIRQQGYNTGYEAGYDVGFGDGESVGYNEGLSNTSMVDFVTALFRAPMEFIDSVLNFEIFGINFATAFKVLVTMCIIGVVVTIVWKAVK